jgi:hypothetical protein
MGISPAGKCDRLDYPGSWISRAIARGRTTGTRGSRRRRRPRARRGRCRRTRSNRRRRFRRRARAAARNGGRGARLRKKPRERRDARAAREAGTKKSRKSHRGARARRRATTRASHRRVGRTRVPEEPRRVRVVQRAVDARHRVDRIGARVSGAIRRDARHLNALSLDSFARVLSLADRRGRARALLGRRLARAYRVERVDADPRGDSGARCGAARGALCGRCDVSPPRKNRYRLWIFVRTRRNDGGPSPRPLASSRAPPPLSFQRAARLAPRGAIARARRPRDGRARSLAATAIAQCLAIGIVRAPVSKRPFRTN